MDKKKLRQLLRISYIIATVLTVVCLVPYFVHIATNPIRDDIFETSIAMSMLLNGIVASFFFVTEYGVYSGLKYFLLEDEKHAVGYVWAVLKIGCSLFVFLQLFILFAACVR